MLNPCPHPDFPSSFHPSVILISRNTFREFYFPISFIFPEVRSPAKPQEQICGGWSLHLASLAEAVKHNSQNVDPLTCRWYWAATALQHYSHFLLRFSPSSCSLVIFAASWWNTLTMIHDYSSPSAFSLHLSLERLPALLPAFLRSCLCSRKPLFYSWTVWQWEKCLCM